MSSRSAISICTALVFSTIVGGWLCYRHDPWAFVWQEKSPQRVVVYDGVSLRNPSLIVRKDKVVLALFRHGSCAGCDTGFPVPTDDIERSHYFDVHTTRDPVARLRILALLSPMRAYGGSQQVLDTAKVGGFWKVAKRKAIACNGEQYGDFIVLDWGDRSEFNDLTFIHPGCATDQSYAALARISKAFEIAAEATNTGNDPRSSFSVERLITD